MPASTEPATTHSAAAVEAIAQYIRQGCTPRSDRRLGLEVESFLRTPNRCRAPYAGPHGGVRHLVKRLARRLDGRLVYDRDHPVGVESDLGKVTLEPGSQLEWSSPPAAGMTELFELLERWRDARDEVIQAEGLRIDDRAFDRTAATRDTYLPKQRYIAMRRRYARRIAPHMSMHQTAGLHLSLDFADEAEWSAMFRAMLVLTPVAIALFANSSGRWRGQSFAAVRPWLWRQFDASRSMLPRELFGHEPTIDAYARWAASRPPLAAEISPTDIADAPGEKLGEMLSLVRSKRVLETRATDRVPDEAIPAVVAFWQTHLYDEDARAELLDQTGWLTDRDRWERLFAQACREGRDARGRLRTLIDHATRRTLLVAADEPGGDAASEALSRWTFQPPTRRSPMSIATAAGQVC